MSKGKSIVTLDCVNPDCCHHIDVKISWYNDPGTMYRSNGDPGDPPDSGWEPEGQWPPVCGNCGTTMFDDVATELVNRWFSGADLSEEDRPTSPYDTLDERLRDNFDIHGTQSGSF